MLVPSSPPGRVPTSGLSVWIGTTRLDDLYALLKFAALTSETSGGPEVRFTTDLYTAFYGQREFGIRDPNGIELMFTQPV